MTDLEMTRLCAEAMGIPHVPFKLGEQWGTWENGERIIFDPLHNDAQAMALVKRLWLKISPIKFYPDKKKEWLVDGGGIFEFVNLDLNRAIVECCAKTQEARTVRT